MIGTGGAGITYMPIYGGLRDPSLSHKKSATLITFFLFLNRPTDPEPLSGIYARETTIAVEVALV